MRSYGAYDKPFAIESYYCILPRLPSYGGYLGPFAALNSKPRQVRKEAAVVVDAGAEVWLGWLPPI